MLEQVHCGFGEAFQIDLGGDLFWHDDLPVRATRPASAAKVVPHQPASLRREAIPPTRFEILLASISEQPIVNVICHRPQPSIRDPFSVESRHAGVDVSHNRPCRSLANFFADGLEPVPDRIERYPRPLQSQRLQQFGKLLAEGIRRCPVPVRLHPAMAILGHEYKIGVGLGLRFRTDGKSSLQSL